MTIEEYTQRIKELKWQIKSKKERLLTLESIAASTTAVITGMPHNPSPSYSAMEEAVLKKLELQKSIEADEAEIRALMETIAAAIDRIDSPKHRTILYKKYLREMTAEDIGLDICYSKRMVRRFLSEAKRMLTAALSEA